MSRNNEKISVIVPCYNVEKYLDECIKSILHQTYSNFELLLVDDGSADNTAVVCDQYALKDSRVIVIHGKNGGVSQARNFALDLHNGNRISCVDSDDYIDADMFEDLSELMEQNDADIAVCPFCNVIDGQKSSVCKINSGIFSGKEIIEYYDYCSISYMAPCGKLYSSKIFDNLRYELGKLHEDEFIFHKIYSRCKRVVCTKTPYYYYRKQSDSIMANIKSENLLNAIKAMQKRFDFMFDNGYSPLSTYKLINQISLFYNKLKVEKNNVKNLKYLNSLKKHYKKILKKQKSKKSAKHIPFLLAETVNPGLGQCLRIK